MFAGIIPDESSFKWTSDGDIEVELRKDHEKNGFKYWPQYLSKQPDHKDIHYQTWWDVKDKHVDFVEDIAQKERKAGLHKSHKNKDEL